MMLPQSIRQLLQNKKQLSLAACVLLAIFGCVYFFYYYSFANRYERIALARPEQLESVRVLRYFSPSLLYALQRNSDDAQLDTGQTLGIEAKPMGIFTALLVSALPIPSAYRVSDGDIGRFKLADGSPSPVSVGYQSLVLQINRQTGHVCYQSDCARLMSICPPSKLWTSPKDPPCQFFKH
jgi:hypothetical protein